MTDEETKSLQWFLENEPAPGLHVYKDDSGDWVSFPTPKMRDHLCDIGVLEKVDVRGLYVFQTTRAGRAALITLADSNGDGK
jgi:hypothetical protein